MNRFRQLRKYLLVASLGCLPMQGTHAQSFQEFISYLSSLALEQRQAVVDSFLTATNQYPVIENDTLAHFIYIGTPGSVTVPGDANGWNPNAYPANRVQGTTLWYHTHSFESDARLDYKFVLNGSTWILDPRNPRQVLGGFGPNSELSMPAYVQPPEIVYAPGIPHGSIRDTVFTSMDLGNSRTIRIYTPPGYDTSADSFAVVYVHDGLEYITLASANTIIDYLTSQGKIEPIIAVFIPPVNRTAEYAGAQISLFSEFVVNDVVSSIDRRYRTRKDSRSRAVLGASNGGNISLWLAFHYPHVFGNVAAFSSNIVDSLFRGFSESPKKDLTLYLDLGTYDIAQLIPLVRNFIPILQSKGYPYTYNEYHEGHSWGNWRAHLDNAMELFFGRTTSVNGGEEVATVPDGLVLRQNYPNPFNPSTTIQYSLGVEGVVELIVYDLLGRIVDKLVLSQQSAGDYQIVWDATRHPSGVYVGQVSAAGQIRRIKMMLVR